MTGFSSQVSVFVLVIACCLAYSYSCHCCTIMVSAPETHRLTGVWYPQADEMFAAANQTAAEAFSNIRTVAAFQMEGSIASLYQKLLRVTRPSPFCTPLSAPRSASMCTCVDAGNTQDSQTHKVRCTRRCP